MKLLIDQGFTNLSWDAELLDRPDHHFLQSWTWGEFQSAIGNKIWRVALQHEDRLVIQLLVIKQSLGLGQSILYSPRGALVGKHLPAQLVTEAAEKVLTAIKEIGSQENCTFFRIDPPTLHDDMATLSVYKTLGFVTNPKKHIQPEYNQVIDLSAGIKATLAAAKPKTRYNISVAQKHVQAQELVVSTSHDELTIDQFIGLTRATAARQNITPHGSHYYKTQIELMTSSGMGDVISATAHLPIAEGKTTNLFLGAIWVGYFGDTATYIHGASSSEHRNLMTPYLLHYHAMELAIQHGLRYYDLGGVHPNPNHPWAGITRFKEGFGGTAVHYVGTLELPLNPFLYKLYRSLNSLR